MLDAVGRLEGTWGQASLGTYTYHSSLPPHSGHQQHHGGDHRCWGRLWFQRHWKLRLPAQLCLRGLWHAAGGLCHWQWELQPSRGGQNQAGECKRVQGTPGEDLGSELPCQEDHKIKQKSIFQLSSSPCFSSGLPSPGNSCLTFLLVSLFSSATDISSPLHPTLVFLNLESGFYPIFLLPY